MNSWLPYLVAGDIPESLIVLLLSVPVMITVIVFARQVIGLTTYGLYIPLIVAISLTTISLTIGLAAILFTLTVAIISRLVLKQTRLLYLAKMGITTMIITVTMILFLAINTHFKIYSATFLSNALLPILILGILSEKFISIKNAQSFWNSLKITIQTIIAAILASFAVGGKMNLGFTIIHFNHLIDALKNFPLLILFFLGIIIVLGKWTGLRVVEYIRFREILRHVKEEEEE